MTAKSTTRRSIVTPTSSHGATAFAAAPDVLWDREDRDDLLLVMRVVGAVVVRRDRRRVALCGGGGDPEIVADEGVEACRAGRVRRVELRVPGVLREPDVVSPWCQGGRVELDARVHAVVRGTVRRQRPAIVGIRGVECDTRRRRLRRPSGGTGEPPVVEPDADRAVRGDVEVRLELVDESGVVVHLDRRRPAGAVVVGRGEGGVRDDGAVVLPAAVKRVVAADLAASERDGRLDSVAE